MAIHLQTSLIHYLLMADGKCDSLTVMINLSLGSKVEGFNASVATEENGDWRKRTIT